MKKTLMILSIFFSSVSFCQQDKPLYDEDSKSFISFLDSFYIQRNSESYADFLFVFLCQDNYTIHFSCFNPWTGFAVSRNGVTLSKKEISDLKEKIRSASRKNQIMKKVSDGIIIYTICPGLLQARTKVGLSDL